MKSNRIVLKALATAVIAASSGLAVAADSQDVTVKAKVKEVCAIENKATALVVDFGELDPSTAPAAEKDLTVSYKCTKGLKPTFTIGGATDMTNTADATAKISFTIDAFPAADVAEGTGFSAAVTAKTKVKIAVGSYKDALKGDYSGTATVTISH